MQISIPSIIILDIGTHCNRPIDVLKIALAPQSINADLDAIVDSLDEILFGSEVAFGGLNGGVAEQQLNLLQIPAGFATQFRAGAAQIVGR